MIMKSSTNQGMKTMLWMYYQGGGRQSQYRHIVCFSNNIMGFNQRLVQRNSYAVQIGKQASTQPGNLYGWRNELLFYKNCVVVPLNTNIVQQLLCELYDSPLEGYSGVLGLIKELLRNLSVIYVSNSKEIISPLKMSVSAIKQKICHKLVFYNRYRFHVRFGMILPRTSSRVFLLQMEKNHFSCC